MYSWQFQNISYRFYATDNGLARFGLFYTVVSYVDDSVFFSLSQKMVCPSGSCGYSIYEPELNTDRIGVRISDGIFL